MANDLIVCYKFMSQIDISKYTRVMISREEMTVIDLGGGEGLGEKKRKEASLQYKGQTRKGNRNRSLSGRG